MAEFRGNSPFWGSHYVAVFFLAGTLSGCAGRRSSPAPVPQAPRFWHGCEQTIPAKADGFEHFVCTDVHDRQWEILVVRKGK